MVAAYNQSRYYFWTNEAGQIGGLLLKALTLLGATLRLLAWTARTLKNPRDREARKQQKLFRRVWRLTRNMTPDIHKASAGAAP
jgi:hypothetical protein